MHCNVPIWGRAQSDFQIYMTIDPFVHEIFLRTRVLRNTCCKATFWSVSNFQGNSLRTWAQVNNTFIIQFKTHFTSWDHRGKSDLKKGIQMSQSMLSPSPAGTRKSLFSSRKVIRSRRGKKILQKKKIPWEEIKAASGWEERGDTSSHHRKVDRGSPPATTTNLFLRNYSPPPNARFFEQFKVHCRIWLTNASPSLPHVTWEDRFQGSFRRWDVPIPVL